jgi:hypothetical protein
MDDCEEFNEDIVDLVTQMSLAEHLVWDADRLDVMRDIILSLGAQVQEQYQLWVEGVVPITQSGSSSIHSMSSHSSRDSNNISYIMFDSGDYLDKQTTATARASLADMDRSKDYILQLRTKLLWYQKRIVQAISMSGSSCSGTILLDHVSAMFGLLITVAACVY